MTPLVSAGQQTAVGPPGGDAPLPDRPLLGTGGTGLTSGAALSLVGSITGAALGFALTVVLARGLGDAGTGIVLQVLGLVTIAAVAGKLGLDSAALWQVPRLLLDRPGSVGALLRLLLGWTLLGGLLAGAGVWAWSLAAVGEEVGSATRAVAWAVPLLSLALVGLAVVRALGSLSTYVVLGNLVLPGLRPLLVVAAIAAGGGVVAATRAWALALVPVVLALVLVLVLQARRIGRAATADAPVPLPPGRTAEIARFALPRAASSVLEQVLVWSPVLLLGVLADDTAAGRYGAAARFVAVGLVVDSALRVVVAPRVSALLHQGRLTQVQALYRTAAGWLVAFGTPGFVLLAVFAPTVLGWLGPGFVAATDTLRVLCLGTGAVFLAGTVHTVLLMGGRPGWAMVNKLAALAVLVVGIVLLTPWFGVAGAAWAWVAAIGVDALLATAQVRRLVGVRHDLRTLALPVGIGLVTAAVPALVAVTIWGQGPTALVIGSSAAAVCFLATVAWLRRPLGLEASR